MFFYLLFAVSLLLAPNPRIVVSVSVLIVLAALSPFVPAGQTILTFYTDPIVCEFALGLLVGAVFTAKVNVPSFRSLVGSDRRFLADRRCRRPVRPSRGLTRSLKWEFPLG